MKSVSAIDRAAADWRVKCEVGLSAAEEREFEEWLAVPEQAEAYAAMDRTWGKLDRLAGTAVGNKLEHELWTRTEMPRRWRATGAALALAAAVAVAYVGWWRPNYFQGEYFTATGEVHKTQLPDGSVVQLNTATVLEVSFRKEQRTLRLRQGEAYFTVAKNPSRPFTVEVQGVLIQAVGTAFNIRTREQGIEVLVTEGRVKLLEALPGPGGAALPQFLDAGQKTVVTGDRGAKAVLAPPFPPAIVSLPADDVQRALAWQDKRLVFVAAPLSEIIAEFNRYHERKLVVKDPALAEQRFGGTFAANDPETFVQLLESNYGVVALRRADHVLLGRP